MECERQAGHRDRAEDRDLYAFVRHLSGTVGRSVLNWAKSVWAAEV
jgi:hypothetical protein